MAEVTGDAAELQGDELGEAAFKRQSIAILRGLADDWDADPTIRSMIRAQKSLLHWPSAKEKGIPKMESIAINHTALSILAKKWCPHFRICKVFPIDAIRPEVCALHVKYGLTDEANIYCDTRALKRLFSMGIRRIDQGQKNGCRESRVSFLRLPFCTYRST
jgi:hypothetical protein